MPKNCFLVSHEYGFHCLFHAQLLSTFPLWIHSLVTSRLTTDLFKTAKNLLLNTKIQEMFSPLCSMGILRQDTGPS